MFVRKVSSENKLPSMILKHLANSNIFNKSVKKVR